MVVGGITGFLTWASEYDSPLAMDSDITELRAEIGVVKEFAGKTRLRVLYGELDELHRRRDEARRKDNQGLMLELDERIRNKREEIENEKRKG